MRCWSTCCSFYALPVLFANPSPSVVWGSSRMSLCRVFPSRPGLGLVSRGSASISSFAGALWPRPCWMALLKELQPLCGHPLQKPLGTKLSRLTLSHAFHMGWMLVISGPRSSNERLCLQCVGLWWAGSAFGFMGGYNYSGMPRWPTVWALAQENQEPFLTRPTGLNCWECSGLLNKL